MLPTVAGNGSIVGDGGGSGSAVQAQPRRGFASALSHVGKPSLVLLMSQLLHLRTKLHYVLVDIVLPERCPHVSSVVA